MLCVKINIVLLVTVNLIFYHVMAEQSDAGKENDEDAYCLVNGVKHKVGESWPGPIGDCTIHKCIRHGETGGLTCPEFTVDPQSGCNITELDLTVQYPDCCPAAVCPPTNGKA